MEFFLTVLTHILELSSADHSRPPAILTLRNIPVGLHNIHDSLQHSWWHIQYKKIGPLNQ
jgi:hypothetical protein